MRHGHHDQNSKFWKRNMMAKPCITRYPIFQSYMIPPSWTNRGSTERFQQLGTWVVPAPKRFPLKPCMFPIVSLYLGPQEIVNDPWLLGFRCITFESFAHRPWNSGVWAWWTMWLCLNMLSLDLQYSAIITGDNLMMNDHLLGVFSIISRQIHTHRHIVYLVGGLVAIFYFPRNIGLLIIPIDFHIFQRGRPNHQPDILTIYQPYLNHH